jgi:hypothetical protein
LFAAVLVGCGNVTGGGVSDTEVYMTGDGSPQTPSTVAPRPAPRTEGAGSTPASAGVLTGVLEGDVVVSASLFLRREDGPLVPLSSSGGVDVTLDLAGAQEPLVATQRVSAAAYDAVVVRFTAVTAHVTGGLEIGGVPFLGTVAVDLGGTSLDVTRPVALALEGGETVALLVDLNADGWIPLLDLLTGSVTATDFSTAVAVTER